LRTSLNTSSFVVAQLVCTMSFESDNDLELYPHVELELRVESRCSSREATVRRSAVASRVLVVGLSGPPLERLWAVRCDCSSC
jgi:hypothetical protein